MEQLFKTLADVSISASVLCALILLARLVIGRRPSMMLPLLGVLLIVRLAVPVTIPSSLSILNLLGGMDTGSVSVVAAEPSLPEASGEPYHIPQYTGGAAESGAASSVNDKESSGGQYETPAVTRPLSVMEAAVIVWLAGAAALLGLIAFCNIRFSRLINKNRPYGGADFDGLLNECKSELGIKIGIRAVQLSGINTAAVYGFLRPRLLVSPSFAWLSMEEKRHVLLHELAHIKRRDTLLCLLITALNIAYWFNPLVWAALRLLRGDMEIMCDMSVLKSTGDSRGYAATLLRLAQSKEPKPRVAGALYMRCSLGLLISTAIRRRIKMITRYKKSSALYTCLALALVITIAIVGCTSLAAETASPGTTPAAANPSAAYDGIAPASPSASAGQETSAPSASPNPGDWHAKFADKFTDGEVERNESSYKSANINVSINRVQENKVTYFVADIYVAEPKYFKTAFPKNSDKMGGREATDVIAKDVGAIIAINGDHCVDCPGPVVRNGKAYRLDEKAQDALVMNYDGSMQAYSASDIDLEKIKNEGAYQVWTFGPMLLRDGQPMTEFDSPQNINGKNPRTAIGYYEPGHYCFVVVDGRQPGYSDGMDMAGLSQLMYDLGCKAAFNLDGGQSSEMAFMGKLVNQPYNGGRSTTDIIYAGEE